MCFAICRLAEQKFSDRETPDVGKGNPLAWVRETPGVGFPSKTAHRAVFSPLPAFSTYKSFRSLRRAAKRALPFWISRHLLKKVDENFKWQEGAAKGSIFSGICICVSIWANAFRIKPEYYYFSTPNRGMQGGGREEKRTQTGWKKRGKVFLVMGR